MPQRSKPPSDSQTELREQVRELQASERRYRELVEKKSSQLEDLLHVVPATHYIFAPGIGGIDYSQQALDILGYAPSELTSDPMLWHNSIHPDDVARVDDAIAGAGETASIDIEYRFKHRDGHWVWLHDKATGKRDETGRLLLVGVAVDVTERRRSEEDLRKQQYYLEKAQEMGHIGTWFLDLRKNRLVWTDENCRIFGVPTGSVVDYETFLGKVHPDDRDYVDREWKAAIEGKPYAIEHRLLIDGETRWVREKADVTFDENGEGVSAIGFTQDFTEHKLAEEAFSEKEAEFRALFEGIQSGVAVYEVVEDGANFVFRDLNRAAEELEGISRDGVIGKRVTDAFPGVEDLGLFSVLQRVWKTGDPEFHHDAVYTDERTPGGSWRENWVYKLPNGNIVAVYNDVTERRQMEEQLRQSEKMTAIGQLAGGIAHDFNNQLAGVLGYADMLESSVTDPSPLRYARNIKKAAQQAAKLTSQLLAFSRKGKNLSVAVDVNRVLADVISILEHSIDKRIEIRREFGAVSAVTMGDPTQIQNAILNIALNARDAMPDGGQLRIETSISELGDAFRRTHSCEIKPGTYLRISVADTGHGMDEATRQRMFEPFFTTKEHGKGTGMGLASAYGAVRNHSGAITVDTRIGVGTTFHVYLPLAENVTPEAEPPPSPPLAAADSAIRILLVDDEDIVREMAAENLTQLGYSVTTCSDGSEAVDVYAENWRNIDLVILDMIMPRMGGRETFAALRAINPQVRSILASGYGVEDDIQTILDEGVLGFVGKPFSGTELTQAIAHALQAPLP